MNKGKVWLALGIVFMLIVGLGNNAYAKAFWGKKGTHTQVTEAKKHKKESTKSKKSHKKTNKKDSRRS